MDINNPESIKQTLSVIEFAYFGSFAAIGGGLAYIMRTLNSNGKITLLRATVEALSSGFVGCIAMLVCKASGLDWMWSGVIVGVFGWLGAEASISMISSLIKQKFGLVKANVDDSK